MNTATLSQPVAMSWGLPTVAEFRNSDALRTQWLQEGAVSGLEICPCNETNRVEMENEFIQHVLSRFPPNPQFELSILSLGSCGLLQDWILLKKLTSLGYQKFNLHFVDPHTQQEKVQSFKHLLQKSPALSANVKIDYSPCWIEDFKDSKRFHCVHAMDFERLGIPYSDLQGWNALVKATEFLENKGILFASAYRKKYVFDASLCEWLHPYQFSCDGMPLKIQPVTEYSVGCTNLGHFWRSTIYHLGNLSKKQVKKIHIEYIKSEVKADDMHDENAWVLNSIHTIQRLAQHVLSPRNQTQIDFTIQNSVIKDKYDLMILGDQFIDKQVLDRHFPMVKPGGIIIINPDDCWQKIDLFRGDYGKNCRLKAELQKKVSDSFHMIMDYASSLATARSIHLG